MQQFNQIFNFLFFVPNFLQKIKKFIKSKKQKFFVFVGSHIPNIQLFVYNWEMITFVLNYFFYLPR